MKPLALAGILCLLAPLAALAKDDSQKELDLEDIARKVYRFQGSGASAIMAPATKGPNPFPARPEPVDIATADDDKLARETLMRVVWHILETANLNDSALKIPNNGITGAEAREQLEALVKGPHSVYGLPVDAQKDLPREYLESVKAVAAHLRAVAGPIEPGAKDKRLKLARTEVMRLRLHMNGTRLYAILNGKMKDGLGIDKEDVAMHAEGQRLETRRRETLDKLKTEDPAAAQSALSPAKTADRDLSLFLVLNEIDLYVRKYASSEKVSGERWYEFRWLDRCLNFATGGLRDKDAAPACVSRRKELLELLRQGKYDDAERILAEDGGK